MKPSHDPKKVPDPHPDCPRCHYWAHKVPGSAMPPRIGADGWPRGIEQTKALEILTKAFPDSYGRRRS